MGTRFEQEGGAAKASIIIKVLQIPDVDIVNTELFRVSNDGCEIDVQYHCYRDDSIKLNFPLGVGIARLGQRFDIYVSLYEEGPLKLPCKVINAFPRRTN